MKTLYYNGRIYTGEGFTDSFVTKDGRFIAIGNQDLPCDEKIDLQKAFVCAGFNDSHMHLLGLGKTLDYAALAEHTASLKDILKYLQAYISGRSFSGDQWVFGRGWNQDYFTDVKRMPSKHDLDQISITQPILLTRACGHCCVLNSRALEKVHITKDTPSPEGGAIDFENGLLYDNAIDMIDRYRPAPDKQQIKEMIKASCRYLNAQGITSSQSDDYSSMREVDYTLINEAYKELEADNELTVRVYEQANFTSLNDLNRFISDGNVTGVGSDLFRIGPLKMLGDGSLGSRSACLTQDYADDPGNRGFCLFPDEVMNDMIALANRHDMQVAVHCIGDRCLDQVLNAIELALKEHPRTDHRHGIVHCQISRADQLERMARLKLHIYAQSIFLDYDNHIVEARVGSGLAATSYSWKTLMNKGLIVSNGSDAPVENPDVMRGIRCGVTRTSIDGTGPYLPQEAFSVKEALDSFTSKAAIASFEEDHKGLIKEGYLADFVVLDQDPFQCDPYHLHEIAIRQTWLGGRCVYQK